MSWRTADFNCTNTECGSTRIVMYDKNDGPGTVTCRICKSPMREGFPAPTVLRASFAEGQERGERWTMLKQSAKLEQEASTLRKNGKKEDAAALKKESKELAKRANTKRDKTDK